MDAQILRIPGNALPLWQAYPPPDISLARLAVPTHRMSPSSNLGTIERFREAPSFLA